jgi:two-component system, NarL family, nitrate/nitrite response regulator NarL
MIRLHRPDVAVLDMRMPKLDGREVMRRLREEQPVTRVLFISEYHGGELVLQALTAGAAGYLPKSSSPEEICDAGAAEARREARRQRPRRRGRGGDAARADQLRPRLRRGS